MAKRKASGPRTPAPRRRNAIASAPSIAASVDVAPAETMTTTEHEGAVETAEREAAHASTANEMESMVKEAATAHAAKPAAVPRQARSLDVFLIDSGWNTPVCTAVHENIPTMAAYLKGQRFFVLNQEQSLNYIRSHPAMTGADPILMVVDRHAATKSGATRIGFRLCLGHVKHPHVAISMLQWAMQLTMTASTLEMTKMVEQSGHRNTVQGVIEIMGEGSAHLLEFAPV